MIKNIVLDIGGVILDISDDVLVKFLNKSKIEIRELSKIVYGKRFNEVLLGNLTQTEYMEELVKQYPKYKEDIKREV